MAIKTKTQLKSFFQTGDIPTENEYADFIDSSVILGDDNNGNIILSGNITASGNISASDTIIGLTGSFVTYTNADFGSSDLVTSGNISSSNISASGNITATNITLPGLGKISFDDSLDGTDQFIQGTDDNITIDGDEKIKLRADNVIEIQNTSTENTIVISPNGGHITASGNISASGTIEANKIILDTGIVTSPSYTFAEDSDTGISSPSANTININAGGSTGEISVTENKVTVQASSVGNASFEVSGHITASGNISGSATSKLKIGGSATFGTSTVVINGTDGHITASGNISASGTLTAGTTSVGALTADTINTGQGATEVYLMNQNVRTSDTPTFTKINTGQGDTEVHLMNQNVRTSDSVTFADLTLTKDTKGGLGSYGGLMVADGPSIEFSIIGIPTIPGRASNKISKPAPTFIRNSFVNERSVIIVTCTDQQLSAVGFGNNTETAIANRGFFLNIGNEAAEDFTATSASFTAVFL